MAPYPGFAKLECDGRSRPLRRKSGKSLAKMDDFSEQINVYVNAKNLPNLDLTSKTDPYCVVDLINECQANSKIRIGHSGVQMDTLNPEFSDAFLINYNFEINQTLVVSFYDKDSAAPLKQTSSHTLIGEYRCQLATLMSANGCSLSGPISGRRCKGEAQCLVRAEVLSGCKDVLKFSVNGKKLSNKDGFFGRSDPFLVIKRCNEDGTFQKVWENKPIMNNLNPSWPMAEVPVAKICNGDLHRPLLIEIYDYDNDGSHDSMGSVRCNLNTVIANVGVAFDVIEIKRGKEKKAGQLIFHMCEIIKRPSFADFVAGGLEISAVFGIDFTASNGHPDRHDSLHYQNPSQMNDYQRSIEYVGTLIAVYDHDKQFPVIGFGGKVNGTTNHCFPLNGGNGVVEGVSGIHEAYRHAFTFATLSGPTCMSPFLTYVLQNVPRCTAESQKYLVCVILADGVITDMEETINALVELSYHPVSVIIIGIGHAGFKDMERLDGDGHLLESKLTRRRAMRDIVQFVAMRDFERAGIAGLGREVLKEVPLQVLSYMHSCNIEARPPPPPYFG